MRRADVIIAAALVVAVLGSVLGVATYDEDGRLTLFTVTWQEVEREESVDDAHTGSGPAEMGFDVTETDVTRVDVVVRVQAAGPRIQGYTIEVEVSGPGVAPVREEQSVQPGVAQTVEIPVTVLVAPVPDVDEVRARDPDAAVVRLRDDHGSTAGQGEWTIRVTFGGGPVPEQHGMAADIAIVSYEPFLTAITPDAPPG